MLVRSARRCFTAGWKLIRVETTRALSPLLLLEKTSNLRIKGELECSPCSCFSLYSFQARQNSGEVLLFPSCIMFARSTEEPSVFSCCLLPSIPSSIHYLPLSTTEPLGFGFRLLSVNGEGRGTSTSSLTNSLDLLRPFLSSSSPLSRPNSFYISSFQIGEWQLMGIRGEGRKRLIQSFKRSNSVPGSDAHGRI